MKRRDLETWLNGYMNAQSVKDSLPNGLQIEGRDEVRRVVVAVSVTIDAIDHAVRMGADAIVVHHGMFWRHDDPTLRGFRKRRIGRLLEHEISLFAYHLPLDIHPEISHNRLILKQIGAVDPEDCSCLHEDLAFGLKGFFPEPLGFTELVGRIDAALGGKARFFKYGSDRIGSIFVVSGAGRSLADKVHLLGVDAYLTGDAQESSEYIAREEGLNYIYAGHYRTEKIGVRELGAKIARDLGLDVAFFETDTEL